MSFSFPTHSLWEITPVLQHLLNSRARPSNSGFLWGLVRRVFEQIRRYLFENNIRLLLHNVGSWWVLLPKLWIRLWLLEHVALLKHLEVA